MPIAREKAQALSAMEELDLTLFFPSAWREGSREYRLSEGEPEGGGYRIRTGRVLFSGRIGGHFYLTGLLRALRETGPELVHLEEEPWSLVAAQVLLFRALLRQRFKVVLFSWENLRLRLGSLRRLIERWVLSRVDVAIAGGEGARGRLIEQGFPAERVAVLPQLGLCPQRFSPLETPERGERDFTIGYVGRLVPAKGVDLLVQAASQLGRGWRLVLIGDGPAREELVGLAESLGVMNRLIFTGWVDHLEVPRHLRQFDVLVLPSRTTPDWMEQFGHVLIEAMACGVPVVGSTSGAISEVIGDAGLVFPEGDSGALAQALKSLSDDESLWKRLAERGRKRVLEHYTWDRLAEKTLSIYRQCLGREPCPQKKKVEKNS
ncbi:MAG: glycosyltransferase [Nitrospinota bacterium]